MLTFKTESKMFGGDGQALPQHLPHHHRNNLSTARSAPSIRMPSIRTPTPRLRQTGSHLASLRVSQAPLPVRVSLAQTGHRHRFLLVVEAAALPSILPRGLAQQPATHLLL